MNFRERGIKFKGTYYQDRHYYYSFFISASLFHANVKTGAWILHSGNRLYTYRFGDSGENKKTFYSRILPEIKFIIFTGTW
jgi:hypothetical protein